ncbi:2-hydroxyacid dehydrogenase [Pullulanibacillus camelliae]|uniref:2-hydroxyacid dehydrogenase n=1 Tax=Pullulanibacillus camelliae TaxID=1707096 RepID=A0A8J3DUB7_9BACL|nr:D-2-hydroxyacid dehydrogenase [Pullulanibacillus camelliae]GGE45595.1 2-hydroxyacid dehydrogenase [Pullulanibacillus camelliae]
MKVVSTANLQKGLQEHLLSTFSEIDFLFYANIEAADEALFSADILITYGEDLTEAHIEQAEQLKWIMVISAGLEKMPLALIKKKGIMVTNARGIHKIPMAEYTIGAMLQFVKNMRQWSENQSHHQWNKAIPTGELAGKTVTIIGPGAIGQEIARLGAAFRMKSLGVSRSGQPLEHFDQIYSIDEIEQALPDADFVVAILPQTEQTEGLIKERHFALMSEQAIFINIGRGKTVVQDDLLKALQSGMIRGAVLDVFEEEPLDQSHPFWEMDNVIVTPHVSSATSEYQPRSITIFEHNLKVYLSGENNFINAIDLDRGY